MQGIVQDAAGWRVTTERKKKKKKEEEEEEEKEEKKQQEERRDREREEEEEEKRKTTRREERQRERESATIGQYTFIFRSNTLVWVNSCLDIIVLRSTSLERAVIICTSPRLGEALIRASLIWCFAKLAPPRKVVQDPSFRTDPSCFILWYEQGQTKAPPGTRLAGRVRYRSRQVQGTRPDCEILSLTRPVVCPRRHWVIGT